MNTPHKHISKGYHSKQKKYKPSGFSMDRASEPKKIIHHIYDQLEA